MATEHFPSPFSSSPRAQARGSFPNAPRRVDIKEPPCNYTVVLPLFSVDNYIHVTDKSVTLEDKVNVTVGFDTRHIVFKRNKIGEYHRGLADNSDNTLAFLAGNILLFADSKRGNFFYLSVKVDNNAHLVGRLNLTDLKRQICNRPDRKRKRLILIFGVRRDILEGYEKLAMPFVAVVFIYSPRAVLLGVSYSWLVK